MPSLRRTLSSPSVRSSPYAYPSSSNANAHATRAGNNQPRRSSGSDTNNRRVLADLDWWLVQDGQHTFFGSSGGNENSDEQDAAENEQVRPLRGNTPPPRDEFAVPPPTAMAVAPAESVLGGVQEEVTSSPLWDVSLDSPLGVGSFEVRYE